MLYILTSNSIEVFYQCIYLSTFCYTNKCTTTYFGCKIFWLHIVSF